MPLSESGPFLSTAVLCETVLEEGSGVRSLIRIIDRVTNTASGAEPPSEMPPFLVSLSAVILIKAGEARGRYALKLRPEDPSGRQMEAAEVPIQLEPPSNRGVFLNLPINLQVELEGVYWIDLLFVDDRAGTEERLTRLPLQIVYQPQRTGPAAA